MAIPLSDQHKNLAPDLNIFWALGCAMRGA